MHDGLGDLTFVKSVAAFFSNQPQRFCDFGIGKDGAKLRYFASGKKHSARFVGLAEFGVFTGPVILDDFRHRIAVLGVMDGWSEQVLPGQPAKTLVRLAPAIDYAGNRYAMDAVMRHGGDAVLRQKFDGKFSRRPTAGVQA